MKRILLAVIMMCGSAFSQKADDYRSDAEQGLAEAQFNLGLCYYNGDGVLQDYNQAAYWFTKAAEQGDASSQYSLGLCYNTGEGVPKSKNGQMD